MGFMRATPAAQHAFLPVLFHPTSSGPGPPGQSTCGRTKIAQLYAENLENGVGCLQPTRQWPWVFKRPGRCAELPAEEVFEGFEGLLLDDELLLDGTDQDDQISSYSKVSREVRKACYAFVSLDAAPAPEVVKLSEAAARLTGVPVEAMGATSGREKEERDKLDQVALGLTGTSLDIFVGAQPFSSNYGGHQFGNWAGQLGDGRVCTLGEIQVEGAPGRVLEVQLKGIGQTPFSRNGDGKAVLGACLREFLFSEAFLGLGLPAAVAVSVCSTGEGATIRDSDPRNSGVLKRARGAVLCRVAPSFLRFGTFELPARRGDVELVDKLADYCLRHLGPCLELNSSIGPTETEQHRKRRQCGDPMLPWKDPGMEQYEQEDEDVSRGIGKGASAYLGMLVAIVQATARMIAGWQAMGFCHGVLNTDNFTLLGFALDFGPCGFMEEYDPAWSPNEGDSALRYAFQNQPDVAAWNCERLAEAFSSIVGVSGVARANEAFSPAFDAAYTSILQRKLGLCGMELGSGWMHPSRSGGGAAGATKDAQFVLEYFRLLSASRLDFTDAWRALLDVPALSQGRQSRRFSEASTQSGAGDAVEGGKATSNNGKGSGHASGTKEHDTWGNKEEALRPLRSVLVAAGASGEQMREWAAWVHEYSSRIDTQGIGKFHPDGRAEGRKERLEIMRKHNPAFVLRAATLEEALKSAEMGGMARVDELEERLSMAYEQDATRQPIEPRAI